jgi:hypothetical protein
MVTLLLVFTGISGLVLVAGLILTAGAGVLALLQVRWGSEVAERIHTEQCAIARRAGRLTA